MLADSARTEEIRARVEKAMDMVHALCQPRGSNGSREWIMSIPARPDHDPDIVIGSSLRDIPALLTELSALREEVERLKANECECGEHADKQDHWLSEKVHDGLGSFTLCVTEDGDIGLFRNDEEKSIGSGDTVHEAIHNAMCRELAALSPSPAQQEGK